MPLTMLGVHTQPRTYSRIINQAAVTALLCVSLGIHVRSFWNTETTITLNTRYTSWGTFRHPEKKHAFVNRVSALGNKRVLPPKEGAGMPSPLKLLRERTGIASIANMMVFLSLLLLSLAKPGTAELGVM